MIFGFAIKRKNGGTSFGVVKADSEDEAKQMVADEIDLEAGESVLIIPAEEALRQYGDVALLTLAEL